MKKIDDFLRSFELQSDTNNTKNYLFCCRLIKIPKQEWSKKHVKRNMQSCHRLCIQHNAVILLLYSVMPTAKALQKNTNFRRKKTLENIKTTKSDFFSKIPTKMNRSEIGLKTTFLFFGGGSKDFSPIFFQTICVMTFFIFGDCRFSNHFPSRF